MNYSLLKRALIWGAGLGWAWAIGVLCGVRA